MYRQLVSSMENHIKGHVSSQSCSLFEPQINLSHYKSNKPSRKYIFTMVIHSTQFCGHSSDLNVKHLPTFSFLHLPMGRHIALREKPPNDSSQIYGEWMSLPYSKFLRRQGQCLPKKPPQSTNSKSSCSRIKS